MQGTERSELAVELERGSRLCQETADAYLERDGARSELVHALLLAAAGFETALHALDERSPAAPTALMIATTLARDAVDAAERRGLDATLLHCVAACRRVIELCE
jgi:hypothetical protein